MASKKQYKTGESQRRAVAEYRKRNPNKQKTIGATFDKAEKIRIMNIYKQHGATVAEVLRGAAYALEQGEPVPLRREPLPDISE